jgi:zinc protease
MALFRSIILAFAFLISAPALAQSGDSDWLYRGSDIARDPAWRFGTLPNGLRYAVRRNALPAGQVSVRIRIDAGALHEEDEEQGWAHFVEHMLFRGTESYPDRQARHVWQQLGASFGSDSNATTSATDTIYQLNLPRADRASLDTSLAVLAEMMSKARFEPAAVDAERPVIIAEKERRPELSVLLLERSRPLFYRGLRIERRDTIGTSETLGAATPEGLKAFYRRWYRPERATIVLVGDADPDVMEALVRTRFGGWRGEGPNPPDPDYGRIAEPAQPVAAVAYRGVPATVSMMWLRPYEPIPHTMARERLFLEESLAVRIVNRRLEAHARRESAFVSSGLSISRARGIANATSLNVAARGGDWRKALDESWAILLDALRAPPSQEEIRRELSNIRAGASAAVEGETTVLSQSRADQLVNAIDNGAVVATATTALENLDRNAPLMTPERVGEAMRRMFEGSGPRTLLVTPEPLPGGERALAEAVAAARGVAPAIRAADRQVSFDDLPALGPPGREVSRQPIADSGVTIVRFDNGSTLTFKPTQYERGTVSVQLRFGRGTLGLAPDRPSLGWLAGLIPPSGLAGLDLDGMERLLTGRRMSLSFGIDEDAFTLSGRANAGELGDQMRLLATKLAFPRWDAELLERFRASAVQSFDLHKSSAAARAGREMGGFVRPNDQRWRPIEKTEMESVTIDQLRAFYAPILAQRPVHAVIVGDVSLESAVEAARRTIAALPRAAPAPEPAGARALRPPAPSPEPRTFTHEGAADQAYAVIGWSTFGGTERVRERRALALAANIFRMRLFDRLRETEGASYSPVATHSSAEAYPDWGIFYAAAELRPASAQTFFRIARELIADLAARPAEADEFERAQNPAVRGIERTIETNGYWMSALEEWAHRPASIDETRTYLSDYRSLTAEEVRAAVARHVADAGDWSMLVLPARAAPAAAPPPANRRP